MRIGIQALNRPVTNGVQAFREPVVKSARTTLTVIVGILVLLPAGIASLTHAYHIGATVPGQPGYQSVFSQLTEAIAGRGSFCQVTIASISHGPVAFGEHFLRRFPALVPRGSV